MKRRIGKWDVDVWTDNLAPVVSSWGFEVYRHRGSVSRYRGTERGLYLYAGGRRLHVAWGVSMRRWAR